MTEPSRLSMSVSNGSSQKATISKLLTLDRVIEYIHKLGLDEYTTKGLIEEAAKYPHQALPAFRSNINLMIQRVRARRKKEQQGVESNDKKENNFQVPRQAISLEEAINFKNPQEFSETQECAGTSEKFE